MSHVVESSLGTHNIAFLEQLYEEYLRDPSSIPADFREYFASLGRKGPSQANTRFGPVVRRRVASSIRVHQISSALRTTAAGTARRRRASAS